LFGFSTDEEPPIVEWLPMLAPYLGNAEVRAAKAE
jgi:hypothetical protein